MPARRIHVMQLLRGVSEAAGHSYRFMIIVVQTRQALRIPERIKCYTELLQAGENILRPSSNTAHDVKNIFQKTISVV